MTLMNTPADRELNKRLIDISKALTTLLCGTSTVDDSAYIRDEALRAVAEQSELARLKLSRAASGSTTSRTGEGRRLARTPTFLTADAKRRA